MVISFSGAGRTGTACSPMTLAIAFSRRLVSRGSGSISAAPLGVVSTATSGVTTLGPRLTTTAVSPETSLTKQPGG